MPDIIAGKYEVIETVGRGGMGTVYKAFQRSMDRIVAVKMLSEDLASDPEFRTRFQQEGQGLGKLSHPNIVSVYDIEPHNHTFCIIMEYLEGETLQAKIDRDGALPEALVLGLGTQVAGALNYAHSRGIIHRDIKPDNIFVTHEGVAKVMDFGIARFRESKLKTQTGISMGTPKFMSPEQVTGKHIDTQTDIYALGVCLYYCLAGQVPFDGENPIAIATRHLYDQPVPPSQFNPAITHETEKVILRAMEKNKLERYTSASDMAEALEACLSARPQVRLVDDEGMVTPWGATRRMSSSPSDSDGHEVLIHETPVPGETPSGIRRVNHLLAAEREAAGNSRPSTATAFKVLPAQGAAGATAALTPAGLLRRWWPAAAALVLIAAGVTIAVHQQRDATVTPPNPNGTGTAPAPLEAEFERLKSKEIDLRKEDNLAEAQKQWTSFRETNPGYQVAEVSKRIDALTRDIDIRTAQLLPSRASALLAERRERKGKEFMAIKGAGGEILAKAYLEGAAVLSQDKRKEQLAKQIRTVDIALSISLPTAKAAGGSGKEKASEAFKRARKDENKTTATESALVEALSLDPENMAYMRVLAEYYEARGLIDDARVVYQYIMVHGPAGDEKTSASQEFRRLNN